MKRLLVPVMLLLGAVPAFASPSSHAQALQNLGLSADAQAQVQATQTRFRDQMKPIWQDARDAHQALNAELAKATPNDAALSKLEDRLSSDRQQMMSLQQQKQAELRKELTPTQYAKLMQARMSRFGRHMHGHRGNGGAEGGGVNGGGDAQ